MLSAALMAALLVPETASGHPMPQPTKELYFNNRCDRGSVAACTHRAALHWAQSYRALRAVSYCESRWDPAAQNPSGAAGLFQFIPGTWASTPYAGYSVYSAKYASLAAAWMWRVGRRSEWVC